MKKIRIIVIAVIVIGLLAAIYVLSQRHTGEKESTVVGLGVPDVELMDAASNKIVHLSDFGGKVIFINFWATWCQPCREEANSINSLFKHFIDDRDFIVLTVLFRDNPEDGIDYLKKNNYIFPLMLDGKGKAARSFGLTGVPETYIIDKKGALRKKVIGPEQWDSPESITLIATLLKE